MPRRAGQETAAEAPAPPASPGTPAAAARSPAWRANLLPPPIHPIEMARPGSVAALRRARNLALQEGLLRPHELRPLTARAIRVLGGLALLHEIHWHLAQRRVATPMVIPAEVLQHASSDEPLCNLLHDLVRTTKCQLPSLKEFTRHAKMRLMALIEAPDIPPRDPHALEGVAARHVLRLVDAAPSDLRAACEAVAPVAWSKPAL